MPRGGHLGLWKPTPKDIFKSRWKRFYKRSYRVRGRGNGPDVQGPHEQPRYNADGVPSPWRLLFSSANFDLKSNRPPDLKPRLERALTENENRFLRPVLECRDRLAQDVLLRSLDAGRRGGADSGYGRLETGYWPTRDMPAHIYNVLLDLKPASWQDDAGDFERFLGTSVLSPARGIFPVRRLRELWEEKEIVWDAGQTDPGRAREAAAAAAAAMAKGKAAQAAKAGEGPGLPEGFAEGSSAAGSSIAAAVAQQEERKEVDRGRFPFIDEQASLIDDLGLREILRLRHRTNSRRHPKWREITYEYKKQHQSYLRRRHMLQDEVKAKMGVLRQAIADV